MRFTFKTIGVDSTNAIPYFIQVFLSVTILKTSQSDIYWDGQLWYDVTDTMWYPTRIQNHLDSWLLPTGRAALITFTKISISSRHKSYDNYKSWSHQGDLPFELISPLSDQDLGSLGPLMAFSSDYCVKVFIKISEFNSKYKIP